MPVVHGLPTPERCRHVPPRDTTTGPPEHAVEDHAVLRPPPTPTLSLIGQQRFQPGPFVVGQIMTMQHAKDLPHPALKIRGTRSSGADAPARRGVFGGSGRSGAVTVFPGMDRHWAVGGLTACPTGAGDDAT